MHLETEFAKPSYRLRRSGGPLLDHKKFHLIQLVNMSGLTPGKAVAHPAAVIVDRKHLIEGGKSRPGWPALVFSQPRIKYL